MPGAFKDNKRTPVKDTLTGIIYQSKYQAGKALAERFDLDPKDNFAWYKALKLAREGRFIDVLTGKPIKKDGCI